MDPTFLLLRRLWRNRLAATGATLFATVLILAVLAPKISPHSPEVMSLSERLASPSRSHLLGTDEMGRDVFTRVLYGARISLSIGFAGILLGGLAGTVIGMCSGFFGRGLDLLVMRIIDVALAFPAILQAILIITVLGPGLQSVVVAIAMFSIPIYARVVRGAVLSLKQMEYIEAARAVGNSEIRVITGHVLPNTVPLLIVQTSLMLANAVLVASSLSFLGLGAQPPTPEWGAMLASSRAYMRTAPWVSVFPGLAITLTVLGLNLFGDGLRDLLDPRLRE